jgi:hypothetical protein
MTAPYIMRVALLTIDIDENKKDNSCEACGARFARSDVLRRHTRKCQNYLEMHGFTETNNRPTRSSARTNVDQDHRSPSPSSPFNFEGHPRSQEGNAIDELGLVGNTLAAPSNSDFMMSSACITMSEIPPNGVTDDFMFLEDFLLPNVGNIIPTYFTPSSRDYQQTGITFQPPTLNDIPDRSRPGLPPTQAETQARAGPDDSSYSHVFYTSDNDVQKFKQHFYELVKSNAEQFTFPRRARIVRCVTAYFDHFDAHVPIIQHATFGICRTHPSLVFMILALGALQLGERNFATSAYDIACTLLDDLLSSQTKQDESDVFELWPVQALLLGVQYGAFGDDGPFLLRAQGQFATASDLLKNGQYLMETKWAVAEPTWENWSRIETFSRLSLWTCTLSAMILATDPTANYIPHYQLREVPIPLQEDLWRARSGQEWTTIASRTGLYSGSNFGTLARALSAGEPIPDSISAFGLLALIGWATSSICTQERVAMSMDPSGALQGDFLRQMERVLNGWENFAYRRLKLDRAIYRNHEPLFTDCFPLLGSAYYHLYVGNELRALKENATRAVDHLGAKRAALPPLHLTDSVLKAVRYAAHSWLVRVRLGIGNWRITNIIGYGVQYLTIAYESGELKPELQCSSLLERFE